MFSTSVGFNWSFLSQPKIIICSHSCLFFLGRGDCLTMKAKMYSLIYSKRKVRYSWGNSRILDEALPLHGFWRKVVLSWSILFVKLGLVSKWISDNNAWLAALWDSRYLSLPIKEIVFGFVLNLFLKFHWECRSLQILLEGRISSPAAIFNSNIVEEPSKRFCEGLLLAFDNFMEMFPIHQHHTASIGSELGLFCSGRTLSLLKISRGEHLEMTVVDTNVHNLDMGVVVATSAFSYLWIWADRFGSPLWWTEIFIFFGLRLKQGNITNLSSKPSDY